MFKSGSWQYSVEQRLDDVSGLDVSELLDRISDVENGKVDKVTGKGLSEFDFTSALKSKLDGIAANATANDTDSNLKNRANHTGTQAISTVTDLQTTLTGHDTRISSLELWRSSKAAASANIGTTTNLPTAIITLGLNAPTAAGIESEFNALKTQINTIKGILRTREILAS